MVVIVEQLDSATCEIWPIAKGPDDARCRRLLLGSGGRRPVLLRGLTLTFMSAPSAGRSSRRCVRLIAVTEALRVFTVQDQRGAGGPGLVWREALD